MNLRTIATGDIDTPISTGDIDTPISTGDIDTPISTHTSGFPSYFVTMCWHYSLLY